MLSLTFYFSRHPKILLALVNVEMLDPLAWISIYGANKEITKVS